MKRKLYALSLAAAVASAAIAIPQTVKQAPTASAISISDLPSEYQYAANWIWENRISNEDSTGSKSKRYNVLFDQIIAGKGTLNYVVRWHSYKTITLAQREGLERLVEDTVNEWTDWLVGYENWPYDHVDVNIVGWAVLDKSLLLDLQSDEVVWDNIHTAYDSTYDTYADFSGRGYVDRRRTIGVVTAGLTKPDLAAPGVGILAPDIYGGYTPFTGTSFAAPIVSGSAALLMEWGIVRGNDAFLYGEKVKAYLRSGARPVRGEAEYPNDRVGFGALCLADSLPV